MTPATGAEPTRWWWVRHAPVPDGGFIYGQRDLDCDCTDRAVFAALARTLPPDAVWLTSNLARTHQTARAIAAAIEAEGGRSPEPEPVPDLAEQHLGEWQGLVRTSFFETRPTHDHWFASATERPAGGESFADLCDRVARTVADRTARHPGRAIVAVTHGGTIRAAIALALGLDPEAALAFTIDNCSVTRLDHLGGDPTRRWKVVTVNHRPWDVARAGTAALA
ncbi:MAG: histidine phosphatase family protein [Methylobacteriaceae bacterium]|nr:histidine phosphatase family protein [Methylobacteriaceae bacterium]